MLFTAGKLVYARSMPSDASAQQMILSISRPRRCCSRPSIHRCSSARHAVSNRAFRSASRCFRHRHPVITPKVARLPLYTTLLVSFSRRAELAVKAPMRTECNEPRRLFPSLTAQYLLHSRRQIVVAELAKDPAEIGERQFVRLRETPAAWHAERRSGTLHHWPCSASQNTCSFVRSPARSAHGFIPVDLRFQAPVVALRHKHLVDRQAQARSCARARTAEPSARRSCTPASPLASAPISGAQCAAASAAPSDPPPGSRP